MWQFSNNFFFLLSVQGALKKIKNKKKSLLAIPIDSTHPLQAMCIRQLHTCMHTTAAALISMRTDVDADVMCDRVCVTRYEKRDHSGYFIDCAFLVWIGSPICTESSDARFMKKYRS